MQLILVGRGDAGLKRLRSAFSPGAAAIADGDALLAAGELEPPAPLGETDGVALILIDAANGPQARRVAGALLAAHGGRRALLVQSDTAGAAWAAWKQAHCGQAAAIDADFPARDPEGFAGWFAKRFDMKAPGVHACGPHEVAGPHAAPPRPLPAPRATACPAPTGLTRLKAQLRERLWAWRHGAAAVAAVRGSPHFDADWYLAVNPDVAAAGLDPALHYLAAGAAEARAPGPGFSTAAWYARHPEARRKGVNPLLALSEDGGS